MTEATLKNLRLDKLLRILNRLAQEHERACVLYSKSIHEGSASKRSVAFNRMIDARDRYVCCAAVTAKALQAFQDHIHSGKCLECLGYMGG